MFGPVVVSYLAELEYSSSVCPICVCCKYISRMLLGKPLLELPFLHTTMMLLLQELERNIGEIHSNTPYYRDS